MVWKRGIRGLIWATTLVSLLFVAISSGRARTPASAPKAGSTRVALYAALNNEITQYDVDVVSATLTKRGSITVPASIQEANASPSRKFLYVAWSNAIVGPDAPRDQKGVKSGVTVLRIDPDTGALHEVGEASLSRRPIYLTPDVTGTHLLVASPEPSGLSVYRLNADGTVGAEVQPPKPLDVGIFAHQVRVDPSNKMVILVTRGYGPSGGKPEDPGAIKVLDYKDGVVTNHASIAPNGGYNFQSRHMDFHPTGPWIYLTLERQNKLTVWKKTPDGSLSSQPLFTEETLMNPSYVPPLQAVGTIHVHPSGKFVYVANRASGTEDYQGKKVLVGGENSIAVFSINQQTGEPTRIQNADVHGISPRTFSFDPSGRIMIVGDQSSLLVHDGSSLKTVLGGMAVFRVGADGKLDFVRKYDVAPGETRQLFWTGMVGLP